MWLLSGSLPLFTAFGIRVRAHASMVIYAALVLLFGLGQGFTWQDRVLNVTVLFAIVLLHEYGHCFTARWVGGEAEDILMHPLGGLAMTRTPHRPLPRFLTVAGGPAVNVVLCVICAAVLWSLGSRIPANPFNFTPPDREFGGWFDIWRYTFWIYQINLALLAFNLLPIYPLDGGQMLQTILWPKFGYRRSTLFSCTAGMVCAVVGAMAALASRNIGLAVLAVLGFMYCMNIRRQVLAFGVDEPDDTTDYSAAYQTNPAPAKSTERLAKRKAKLARDAAVEQREIDDILAKVSAQGMHSLTFFEKRALKRATERQRQRDSELSRLRQRT